MATVREIANKIGGNGSKTPQDVAKALNQKQGTPLNIGATQAPLNESGNTLPSVTIKGKK